MIIHEAAQGTDEWLRARLGIPSASNFSKVLSPTGKRSTQARAYRMKLLAQWLTGDPDADGVSLTTGYMERGYMLQPEAIKFYEFEKDDATVEPVGFCYLDGRKLIGCSPDGLVGDKGLVEIKCPSGGVQMAFLLGKGMPDDHIPQVQGQIWVTGREWCDFISYHDQMPSDVVRVERDEPYIELLSEAVEEFVAQMLTDRATLIERGFKEAA